MCKTGELVKAASRGEPPAGGVGPQWEHPTLISGSLNGRSANRAKTLHNSFGLFIVSERKKILACGFKKANSDIHLF